MYYCPFKDKNGNDLCLEDITYEDLKQLVNFEEGYKLEFKSTFGTDTKNKLPKVISSFANCSGGWLFIGIENSTKQIVDIDKPAGEIELNIINIIKNFVDLEVVNLIRARFVENPIANKKGVILVYVDEGLHPPYISNGTIFVRSGAQSEPIKAERFTVDNLYKKSEKTSIIQLKGVLQGKESNFFECKSYKITHNIVEYVRELKDNIIKSIKDLEGQQLPKNNCNYELEKIKANILLSNFLGQEVSLSKHIKEKFDDIYKIVSCLELDVDLNEVFNLGDLCVYEKMNLYSMRNELQLYGTEKEKDKYYNLCKLSKDINSLFSAMPLANKFADVYFVSLAITNKGNNFDEDIILRIYIPKGSFCNLSDLALSNELKEYNQRLLNILVEQKFIGMDEYDDGIPYIAPSPPMHMFNEFYTKSEETYQTELIESKIKNAYENFEIQKYNDEFDVIKITFRKLIPQQTQLFPAPLILTKDIDEMRYEIISKYSSKKNLQTLKKTP